MKIEDVAAKSDLIKLLERITQSQELIYEAFWSELPCQL